MRAITQPNENAEDRLRPAERRIRAGFTLIEMLVVIALTAILMTVIFVPLVNTYALTGKADTQIQSQASARSALYNLTDLLTNADFVYDNAVTTQVNGGGQTSPARRSISGWSIPPEHNTPALPPLRCWKRSLRRVSWIRARIPTIR